MMNNRSSTNSTPLFSDSPVLSPRFDHPDDRDVLLDEHQFGVSKPTTSNTTISNALEVERQNFLYAVETIRQLRERLVRRTKMIEDIRRYYLRDIVSMKYIIREVLSESEREEVWRQYDANLPSLNLKDALQLHAPEKCVFQVAPCETCGGQLEIILKDTDEVDRLKKLLMDSKDREARWREKLAVLDAQIEQTTKERAETTKSHLEEKKVLYNEMKKLKEEIEKVKVESAVVLQQNKQIKDENKIFKESNLELFSSAKKLISSETEIENLKVRRDELQDSIKLLKESERNLNQIISSQKEEIRELSQAKDRLTNDINYAQLENKQLNGTISVMEIKTKDLENTLEEANKKTLSLTKKIHELEENNRSMIELSNDGVKSESKVIDSLRFDLKKVNDKLKECEASLAVKTSEVQELEFDLDDLEKESEEKDEELAEKDDEIEKLEAKLDSFQQFIRYKLIEGLITSEVDANELIDMFEEEFEEEYDSGAEENDEGEEGEEEDFDEENDDDDEEEGESGDEDRKRPGDLDTIYSEEYENDGSSLASGSVLPDNINDDNESIASEVHEEAPTESEPKIEKSKSKSNEEESKVDPIENDSSTLIEETKDEGFVEEKNNEGEKKEETDQPPSNSKKEKKEKKEKKIKSSKSKAPKTSSSKSNSKSRKSTKAVKSTNSSPSVLDDDSNENTKEIQGASETVDENEENEIEYEEVVEEVEEEIEETDNKEQKNLEDKEVKDEEKVESKNETDDTQPAQTPDESSTLEEKPKENKPKKKKIIKKIVKKIIVKPPSEPKPPATEEKTKSPRKSPRKALSREGSRAALKKQSSKVLSSGEQSEAEEEVVVEEVIEEVVEAEDHPIEADHHHHHSKRSPSNSARRSSRSDNNSPRKKSNAGHHTKPHSRASSATHKPLEETRQNSKRSLNTNSADAVDNPSSDTNEPKGTGRRLSRTNTDPEVHSRSPSARRRTADRKGSKAPKTEESISTNTDIPIPSVTPSTLPSEDTTPRVESARIESAKRKPSATKDKKKSGFPTVALLPPPDGATKLELSFRNQLLELLQKSSGLDINFLHVIINTASKFIHDFCGTFTESMDGMWESLLMNRAAFDHYQKLSMIFEGMMKFVSESTAVSELNDASKEFTTIVNTGYNPVLSNKWYAASQINETVALNLNPVVVNIDTGERRNTHFSEFFENKAEMKVLDYLCKIEIATESSKKLNTYSSKVTSQINAQFIEILKDWLKTKTVVFELEKTLETEREKTRRPLDAKISALGKELSKMTSLQEKNVERIRGLETKQKELIRFEEDSKNLTLKLNDATHQVNILTDKMGEINIEYNLMKGQMDSKNATIASLDLLLKNSESKLSETQAQLEDANRTIEELNKQVKDLKNYNEEITNERDFLVDKDYRRLNDLQTQIIQTEPVVSDSSSQTEFFTPPMDLRTVVVNKLSRSGMRKFPMVYSQSLDYLPKDNLSSEPANPKLQSRNALDNFTSLNQGKLSHINTARSTDSLSFNLNDFKPSAPIIQYESSQEARSLETDLLSFGEGNSLLDESMTRSQISKSGLIYGSMMDTDHDEMPMKYNKRLLQPVVGKLRDGKRDVDPQSINLNIKSYQSPLKITISDRVSEGDSVEQESSPSFSPTAQSIQEQKNQSQKHRTQQVHKNPHQEVVNGIVYNYKVNQSYSDKTAYHTESDKLLRGNQNNNGALYGGNNSLYSSTSTTTLPTSNALGEPLLYPKKTIKSKIANVKYDRKSNDPEPPSLVISSSTSALGNAGLSSLSSSMNADTLKKLRKEMLSR